MEFRSQYACPTRIIHGGGEGTYGLCAMEILSVMTGDLGKRIGEDLQEETYPQYLLPSTVNEELNRLVYAVNDSYNWEVSVKERTGLLWPILPSLIDTSEGVFPTEEYKAALGVEDLPSYTLLSDLPSIYARAKFTMTGEIRLFPLAVEALKTAIRLFHETNKTTPLPDYLPEHMERLNAFLAKHEGNEMLAPLED